MKKYLLVILILVSCGGADTRESIVAGSFYPAESAELKKMLDIIFGDLPKPHISGEPILLIEPHAGYVYSGQIAAYGYQLISQRQFPTVIILGPSHRHYLYGASVDTLAGHKTPLGSVEFDQEIVKAMIKKGIKHIPAAHSKEHSLEVQLPFLQYKMGKFKVVEIVIGDHDFEYLERFAHQIYQLVKKKEILIIASSDLSHFHNYRQAVNIDKKTIDYIKNFDAEGLYKKLKDGSCEACGGAPIIVGLLLAQQLGANHLKPLTYANSGDVTGDSSRVVGYLAAVAYKKKEIRTGIKMGLSNDDKKMLKQIALDAISAVVLNRKFIMPEISNRLKEKGGAFVTINKDGNLRGCIGFIKPVKPLNEAVVEAAQSAAVKDRRFQPLSSDEIDDIEIEISVLSKPVKVDDVREIKIGRDGLIIKRGFYQGLLLPQVATEYDWGVYEFLAHTCIKAGLPADAWKKEGTEIYKFSAEVF